MVTNSLLAPVKAAADLRLGEVSGYQVQDLPLAGGGLGVEAACLRDSLLMASGSLCFASIGSLITTEFTLHIREATQDNLGQNFPTQ